jgi:hypothetical protein
MIAAVLTLMLVQQPVPPPPTPPPSAPAAPYAGERPAGAAPGAAAPADTAAGRPCQVAIDTVGHFGRQVEVRPGETNLFAGGGVKAHCQGATSTLTADSVAWYAGVGRFDMLGNVRIRDTAIALDATTAAYFLRQERLDAHKDVVAVNRATGSVLRGPNLTYYRAVHGVRDTAEMYATSRPTIDYRATPDSGEPYVIVADRVRLKGNDRVWGGGSVTIDRSDLAAQGDSMMLDEALGIGVLVGRPQVRGKGARHYELHGRRIEFTLVQHDVRLIKALGAGEATGSDWRLTADTIYLRVEQHKLQQVFAWGDSTRPDAVSTLHTLQADSLALDVPDEALTAARAFRRALSTSRTDSTAAAERDWIAGDTITAHWHPANDSAGANATLDRLIARGKARALTHMRNERDSTTPAAKPGRPAADSTPRASKHRAPARDSTARAATPPGKTADTTARGPSINYSRGDVIDVAMNGDRIDRVLVIGHADGLHLEPAPPKPVKDSVKAQPNVVRGRKRPPPPP